MENKIELLLDFISNNFSNIRFEIIHNSLSPSLKHFVIKDSRGEKGFGTDHNLEIAIEKAYSEYVERKTFQTLNKIFNNFETSNGFSAHKSVNKSKANSTFEIIERDAFLNTWHAKIAPYWMTNLETNSLLNDENKFIMENHKVNGLMLKLGIVASTNNVYTLIAKVNGKKGSKDFFYIDTKAGTHIDNVANALVESVSFFSHYFTKGLVNVKKPINFAVKNPIDHFFYHIYNRRNCDWFHVGGKKVLKLSLQNIRTHVIYPDEILGIKKSNRIVTFSEASIYQDYFCGKFDEKKINLKRFTQLFGSKIQLNQITHPLS